VTSQPNLKDSRRERIFSRYWLIPLVYILLVAYFQKGWRGAESTYVEILLIVGGVGLIVGLIEHLIENPIEAFGMGLFYFICLWFYFSGSYRYGWLMLWDVLGIAIGAASVALSDVWIPKAWRDRLPQRIQRSWPDIALVFMIVGAWAGISLIDWARESPLKADSKRFDQIGPQSSIVPVEAQKWANLRIGLALSGGGYRAALFHAGLLHALEKLGIRVKVLSTVSGGSIIGAYYSVGGDPVAFKDAVKGGRLNLKRRMMLLHNAVRLPFPLTVPGTDIELAWLYPVTTSGASASLMTAEGKQ
jgi:hypothetical protein